MREKRPKPILHPKWRWKLMSVAKRTGGWDLWLGKRWGWDLDDDPPPFGEIHWHLENYPWIVNRSEY